MGRSKRSQKPRNLNKIHNQNANHGDARKPKLVKHYAGAAGPNPRAVSSLKDVVYTILPGFAFTAHMKLSDDDLVALQSAALLYHSSDKIIVKSLSAYLGHVFRSIWNHRQELGPNLRLTAAFCHGLSSLELEGQKLLSGRSHSLRTCVRPSED
jgi:hypothetical protein